MRLIKYIDNDNIQIYLDTSPITPDIQSIPNIGKLYTFDSHKLLILSPEYIYSDLISYFKTWEISILLLPIHDLEQSIQIIDILWPKIASPIAYDNRISSQDGIDFGYQVMSRTKTIPKFTKSWQSIILK